jgi:cysteine desulfurase/selenocysteine lyase
VPETPLPRDEFPIASRFVYLDNATASPLPLCAARAAKEYLDDVTAKGGLSLPRWEERAEEVRESVAALLEVPAQGIAFVKNTTEGMAFVANGLQLGPGDRVLVPDHEFPSTAYPWVALRDRGVVVDFLDPLGTGWTLPLRAFRKALEQAPTRVVATSWVQFGRGWRTDLAALAALCHRHGALLCTDAIQGLGVLPAHFEVWDVDFAVADGNTWMLGPMGTGVFYSSERSRPLVHPSEPGRGSVEVPMVAETTFVDYADSARRFEGGALTFETITQLGASADLLLKAGVEDIWAHVDALLDRAVDGLRSGGITTLSDRSVVGRSASITIDVPGCDPASVQEQLRYQDIICAVRAGGVRISPHGYNTTAEIDRLVEAVRHIAHG